MTKSQMRKATALDIMTGDAVTVSPNETLSDALQTMVENHVTGLPVMDSAGHCVGVISAMDILNFEQDHSDEAEEANAENARYFDQEQRRWESLRASTFALEHFGHIPVREIMTSEVISTGPETPVNDVAQLMVDHEVHRVMVVSQTQHLLGTISAFDIVKLVAGALLPK